MKRLKDVLVLLGMVWLSASAWAADSGFLSDYSKLEATADEFANRVYVAPNAKELLASYSAVMIDQPEVYIAADSKHKGAKPDHLKVLADTLRQSMTDRFEAGGYTTVDEPGPGVVYMRWAVTDLYLKKKKRRILSYTPVGFVVHTTAQVAIKDLWKKIDIVELNIEAEFIDSATDEVIGAVVMERGARKAKGQKQDLVTWEELDVAMKTFGERVRCRWANANKSESEWEDCAQIVAAVGS